MVSAVHVGGTRGSGSVSSVANELWMSVVLGMRGVGGVCVWLGAAWVERGMSGCEDWVWALPILWEQRRVLDVCPCFGCSGVGGVIWGWVGGLDQGLEGWCYVLRL